MSRLRVDGLSGLALIKDLIDALFKASYKGLRQLALFCLRLLVLNKFAFKFIFGTFTPDFSIKVADEVVAPKQIIFKVVLDDNRELLWVLFCVIKGVFHKLSQLLVIVLRVFK